MNPIARQNTLTVHGTSLAFRIEGEGAPLLFVHGSVADLTTFDAQVALFSLTHRAITYSRRFHPPNQPPGPSDVYDTLQQADDMQAFAKAVGADGAVAIGSSFGAYIALVCALHYPGIFRGLVLCEPPMIPLLLRHPRGLPLHDAFITTVMEPSRRAFLDGYDELGLGIFIDGIRGQPGSFQRMLPGIRADLMRFAPEMKAEFSAPRIRYMVEVAAADLGRLSIPVLLVGGNLSTPMFSGILDVLERELPHTRREAVPRAGHLLHLQNPGRFAEILKEFLGSVL